MIVFPLGWILSCERRCHVWFQNSPTLILMLSWKHRGDSLCHYRHYWCLLRAFSPWRRWSMLCTRQLFSIPDLNQCCPHRATLFCYPIRNPRGCLKRSWMQSYFRLAKHRLLLMFPLVNNGRRETDENTRPLLWLPPMPTLECSLLARQSDYWFSLLPG